MLDAYRKLQANGAIGPMMKVNAAGEAIFDPGGEQPGNLIVRPFQEYPKAIKRWKDPDGITRELIAHSKAEELKIISERIEEFSGDQRSPLERERDDLARGLADQQAINGQLEMRLQALAAQVEQLTRVREGEGGVPGVQGKLSVSQPAKSTQSGLASFSAEQKAVLNQK